jgi:hypothetical protein
LPQKGEQLHKVVVGEMVSTAGWGKMNMTTEKRADVLQMVPVSKTSKMIKAHTRYL